MRQKDHFLPIEREDFRLDPRWCVCNDEADTTRCILMLAGRGQKQNGLPSLYWHYGLRNTLIIGVAGRSRAWYPQPKGAQDQWAAVRGLPYAVSQVEMAVSQINKKWGIRKNRIVLLGYSAGGVMAIQAAAHSREPYAGAVCQCGAILAPEDLPPCRHRTPILLTHSRDDEAFEWYERYEPMKTALIRQQYPFSIVESPFGGHSLNDIDIAMAKLFIGRCFR